MSNPLAKRSSNPPGSRKPSAISTADPAQMHRPRMVRTLGVRRRARSAGTTRRAPALTHSWSLDVNTGWHGARTGTRPRHAIHIKNFVDHVVPVVQLRFGETPPAHRCSSRL